MLKKLLACGGQLLVDHERPGILKWKTSIHQLLGEVANIRRNLLCQFVSYVLPLFASKVIHLLFHVAEEADKRFGAVQLG